MAYDLVPLKAPVLAGRALRTTARLLENSTLGAPLARKLLGDAGILDLRKLPATEGFLHGPRLPLAGPPEALTNTPGTPLTLEAAAALFPGPEKAKFLSAHDYAAAYRRNAVTPTAVAERLIEAVAESERTTPPMRFFISFDAEDLRRQAAESTARFAAGAPLGPLDGVPIAVKDELDQRGYPTSVGTCRTDRPKATEDATVVARLRAGGALLLGKANMHELGLGVTGINPHHGPARNPYDPSRATGGSSSGSAAAVAAGLCPIAIGADGGGSIRIPGGLCGVFGLKATRGRVSEHGVAPLCWSVGHVGPLSATARDLVLAYAAIAGPDPHDPTTAGQPLPTFDGMGDDDLTGLRVGVYTPWFNDADEPIVSGCRAALADLEARGARLVEVEVPELRLLRTVHLITIVSEMVTALASQADLPRGVLAGDTRLSLALGDRLKASDFIHAQRHRLRLEGHYAALLGSIDAPDSAPIDVLATPSTATVAPPIRPAALAAGESNMALLDRIMRFAQPANITGLPAITIPVAYDPDGLPIGLQLMGRAWDESLLLRLALALESTRERRLPVAYHRLLDT